MTDTTQRSARSSATEIFRPRGISPALMQRRIRDFHLYLSMLFAPSLLFFAATGALQLFNLHEVRSDRAFQPPALLQELGMVHKDQVFALPRRRESAPPGRQVTSTETPQTSPATIGAAPLQSGGRRGGWIVLALKGFFLLASLGLFTSTCLGIWIGTRPGRNRRLGIGLLIAGVIILSLLLAL